MRRRHAPQKLPESQNLPQQPSARAAPLSAVPREHTGQCAERRGQQTADCSTDQVVDAVVSYINEHYNEPLTLDLLAEKFFISKYHLLRKFDAQMGTTVHRYILQKRLLIAKQLLAGGVAPSEACGYCGFGDYANFYRAFRSEYGATPRQYAQSVQKIG